MGGGSCHHILFLSLLSGLSSSFSCCLAALTEVTYPWTRDVLALEAKCGGWGWVVGGLITCGREADDTVMLCVCVSPQLSVKKSTQLYCLVHALSLVPPTPHSMLSPTVNSIPGRAVHSSTRHGHRCAAGGVAAIGSHHVFEWCEFLGVCFL